MAYRPPSRHPPRLPTNDGCYVLRTTYSWTVIRRHMPLYALTQFFDYLGSIINYAAVGGAILYLSKAEGKGEAEISALVARGSYSCLYLINAFSQVNLFFFCSGGNGEEVL